MKNDSIKNYLNRIIIFDDGNERYREYPNKWIITSYKFYGSKLTLRNFIFQNIKIESISNWKVVRRFNFI